MASVLIVEDEAELRDVFQTILRKEGYDVVPAAGALEALAAYEAHRPDVVVSDVFLPDASGLNLIEYFSRSSDAAVVVVSGTDGDGAHDLLVSALLLGACATLRKPVRRADLVAAVGAAIVHKRNLARPRTL